MQNLLAISLAIFAGLMLSRLAKLAKLPAVTAYLVAGILVGPFCLGQLGIDGLGFVSEESVEAVSIISQVALGFIAFSIGIEFRVSQLKKIGKQATVIGIVQALVTALLVDAVLIGVHFAFGDKVLSLSAALTLGAIATATAPAATLMVVKQYKAKGPLTSILLPVVALDDAVGLVVFSVSFGIAKALVPGGTISIISIIVEPILEVLLSLILGAVMGLLFTFFERFFHSRSKRLSMSVAFVLLTVDLSMMEFHIPVAGQSIHVKFSSLLTCMMLGTIFCNICDFSEELMDRVDRWTAPIFVLFFVISGAELNLLVFTNIAVIAVGLVYILSRCAGKYSGAFLSAKAVKCDRKIVNYLGMTLFPQAGVALGMALIVGNTAGFEGDAEIVRNITLFAVLVYELIGPVLTKISLLRAGEIRPDGKTSAREAARIHKMRKHQMELEHARAEKEAEKLGKH